MRLIIVDGLDGVGKDTHAQLIKKRYETKGLRVMVRSHPESDNVFGKSSKKALLGSGKINQLKASAFYALDVLHSLKQYYHRNREYDVLILVRYLMGTAYLPDCLVRIGYGFFVKFVPTSEYMFFLDASPEELTARVKTRFEVEMFETLEEFVKVRKKALMLTKKGWHSIDTSGSVEETFASIEQILDQLDLHNT